MLICMASPANNQYMLFNILLFSCSVMSNSLWCHGLQHARLPCPSPSPGACSNLCPLSLYITQPPYPLSAPSPLAFNLPSIKVFSNESALHIRWPTYWIFSFSISPFNEFPGFISCRIDWFDLLEVQGTLKSLPQTTVQKHPFSGTQPSLWSNTYIHTWLLEKPQLWPDGPLSAKQCLCFLICYLGCHSFPSKEQEPFNFMAAVTICSDFGAQENKVCHCFHCLPIYIYLTYISEYSGRLFFISKIIPQKRGIHLWIHVIFENFNFSHMKGCALIYFIWINFCYIFTAWGIFPEKAENPDWFGLFLQVISWNHNYLRENKKI